MLLLSSSVLEDAIAGIGFPIVFYYRVDRVACAIYYGHGELTRACRPSCF